jgi:hypothetical protein
MGDLMPGLRSFAVPCLAAAVAAAAVVATCGSVTGLVSIVPVFLLLTPLLLRSYPGERQIARLRAARSRAARCARPVDDAAPATTCAPRLTGRTVLGRRLAVRPPPALPAQA